MKQKFLYFVFFMLLSTMFNKTYAQTVEVESLTEFTTANPPASITVKLAEPLKLSNDVILDMGTTVKGDLIDVESPKRLKRDAKFSFKPTSYIDLNGNTNEIEQDIIASYSEPIDKGQVAKNTALGVGSYFVKGLSMGVAAVEGAVKNEEENRFKSSVVSVYESSPLSLANKGEDIEIKQAQMFYLKFPNPHKIKDSEEKGQNYTDTIEKE